MAVRRAKVSSVRKALGDFFTDAAHRDRLTVIARYGKEQVFLLGANMLQALIEASPVPQSPCRVVEEDDESLTLVYEPLDIVVNAESLPVAIDQLLEQIQIYADLYLEDPRPYLRSQDLRKHLPLLLGTVVFQHKGQLARFLGLPASAHTMPLR